MGGSLPSKGGPIGYLKNINRSSLDSPIRLTPDPFRSHPGPKLKAGLCPYPRPGLSQNITLGAAFGIAYSGEEFVDSLADYLKKYREVPEIPKSQRYVNKPTLEKILQENILRDRRKRNRKIAEAVFKHGYRQSEIARHLGMHYSTISNLLREKA
jgi:hypothetical protein